MAEQRGQATGRRARIASDAELAQDGGLIEVDALADDPILGSNRKKAVMRQRKLRPVAGVSAAAPVSAEQVELDDDRVLGVV